jgi:uncharacterized protein (UPF0303 family)
MINKIATIEQAYSFLSFDAHIAFELGMFYLEQAKKNNLPIVVDISSNDLVYFHFANTGSTPNNERFIQRKSNTVMRFYHSTWWVNHKVNHDTNAMHEKYGTNNEDFSILYGGWPILVKGLGVIGSICISGLTQEQDNQLIMDGLNQYFNIDYKMDQIV